MMLFRYAVMFNRSVYVVMLYGCVMLGRYDVLLLCFDVLLLCWYASYVIISLCCYVDMVLRCYVVMLLCCYVVMLL